MIFKRNKKDFLLVVLSVLLFPYLFSGSVYRPFIKPFTGPSPVLDSVTEQIILTESSKLQVPYDIALFLALAESGGDPIAEKRPRGSRGIDQGLYQINSRWLGDFSWRYNNGKKIDPFSVMCSTRVALRYLKSLYGYFGTWYQALEAYNAGPRAVEDGDVTDSTKHYAEWIINGGFP